MTPSDGFGRPQLGQSEARFVSKGVSKIVETLTMELRAPSAFPELALGLVTLVHEDHWEALMTTYEIVRVWMRPGHAFRDEVSDNLGDN